MPFVFGFAGIILVVAGVRNQTSNLFSLVKSDFSGTGTGNYFEWMIAIFLVGAIGYVKQLSTISRLFMFLVMAGLLYKDKNVLSELASEEQQTPATTQTSTGAATSSLPSLPPLPSLSSNLEDYIL